MLRYNSIERLTKSGERELLIGTVFGDLRETRPFIYQEIEGKKVVRGGFEIRRPAGRVQTGKFAYGFQIAAYNPSYPLIIDPTLSYATYLGGKDHDIGNGIAVDGSGNAYITGYTWSNDFPTQNPYQGTRAGMNDAFVAKLIDTTPQATPAPDIKANASDGPIVVSSSTPIFIEISLNPGDKAGQNADWWIGVKTPFDPPLDWCTYVKQNGWRAGINLYTQSKLLDVSENEVLNMILPLGTYTFYFAIDDPDGAPTGPWWGLDSVELTVRNSGANKEA